MAEIKFVPFTEFAPDQRLIGGEVLHEAKNMVPLFGQYRLVNKLSPAGTGQASDSLPPTGSHSQVQVEEITSQFGRPKDQDVAVGGIVFSEPASEDSLDSSGFNPIGLPYWNTMDEEEPNDGDYSYANGIIPIGITPLDDPAVGSDHIIRYRYRITNATPESAYDVDLILRDEGISTVAIASDSGVVDIEGNTEWKTVEYTLTTIEADDIQNYDDLHFWLSPTILGTEQKKSPVEDTVAGSWTKQDGTGGSLFTAIDESTASDVDYIQSAILAPGQADTVKFKLDAPDKPLIYEESPDDDVIFRWRARCSQPSCELEYRVLSGESDLTTVSSSVLTPSAVDAFIDIDIDKVEFNRDAIDYDKPLYIEFTASMPADGEFTETTFISPTSENNVLLTWADSTDTADLVDHVDETVPDDGDFITSLAINSDIYFDFPPFDDPKTDYGFIMHVRARLGAASGNHHLALGLYEGNREIWTSTTDDLTGDFVTYEIPVNPGEFSFTRPFGTTNLSIRIRAFTAGIDVSYVALEYPTPARVDISFLEFETPSLKQVQWSWAEFEVPSTVTSYVGDKEQYYTGTKTALYQFDGQAFSDVSIAGGYGTGSFFPLSWDFVQWGNDVIATNYVDPVQVQADGAGLFADLITSTEKPKARFVDVISNHLILANINHNTHFPDEVWWSGIDDSTDFDPDITTQSDYQRLLPTAGEITGIIGGAEFGYVFKQNSIYRMNYVGYPEIFTFHIVADEGTKYAKSIVRVGDRVFFFGSGGFRVLEGNQVRPIGDLKVTKFLVDAEYEDNYIFSPLVAQEYQMQNSIVGWYDRISRLIFWAYRGPGDDENRLNHIIVYSPLEDKWGRVESTDMNISSAGPLMNNSLEDSFLFRGGFIFTWDGSTINFNKLSDNVTYQAELKTSVISLEPGRNVTVLFVRPVWGLHTEGEEPPILTIDITAGEEPTLTGVTSTATESVASYTADEDGWIPVSINGEFFQFTLHIPELTGQNQKEFSGLQLKLAPGYAKQRY